MEKCMSGKIGFACKWLDNEDQINGFKPNDPAKKLNTGTTTVRWLNENISKKNDKLWDLVRWNIHSVENLVNRVSTLPENQRMVRLSSDILPVFTEPTHKSFYTSKHVLDFCENSFAKIGDIARANDVRLSFHPGQFCVLASDNPAIVENSIEEFEYHVTMARWMGYGSSWHDHGFKINVHISGKNGADGIIAALPRLSTEARNLITIENEEMKWGLSDILKLKDHVALVLDIHHHHVNTGKYIQSDDLCIKEIIDSWRGVRPTIHYSMSKSEYVSNYLNNDGMVDYDAALKNGITKNKLRAHSDFMWNHSHNEWAKTHWKWADIMVEAKFKNLASSALAQFWKS